MTVDEIRRGRLLVVAVIVAIVAMLTIVIRRGCLVICRATIGGRVVGGVRAVVGVVLRIVRKRPQLRLPPRFPDGFQNLLLVVIPCDCHLLHVHIYVDVVHA